MPARTSALLLAAGLALGLAGCHRQAMDNPNAPSSPGTGNPTAIVTPAAPDTPPGAANGVAGSTGHPGASVADAVPGTTGKGGGATAAAQPGQGPQGGMGAMGAAGTTAASPSGAASSSAPTGQDLPSGGPGTTYHSPGKN